jgi:SAM-dependent methyltransferase
VLERRVRPWELPPYAGESIPALHFRQDTAYFAEQVDESVDWWDRMGEAISLNGLRVLEFGCGHGALTLSAAKRGAAEVLGIDLDRRRIDFARRHIPAQYPDYAKIIRFEAADIANIDDVSRFDVVLSKDTFEHVENLPATIDHMYRVLKPGGRLMVGFSPLFHSPFGDHGRLAPPLPWLPALLPERLVFSMARRRHKVQIDAMADVGLNKLTPAQFRASFPPGKWSMDRIRYNRSKRRLMPVLNVMRLLPGFERWFTVGIYAIVTRK